MPGRFVVISLDAGELSVDLARVVSIYHETHKIKLFMAGGARTLHLEMNTEQEAKEMVAGLSKMWKDYLEPAGRCIVQ